MGEISLFEQDLECSTPWFYDTLCERKNELQAFLKAQNIGTRVMYPPINEQEAYRAYFATADGGLKSANAALDDDFKVSNLVGQKGLWLPSATQLTNEQIAYICEKIREFYGAC